MTTNFSPDTFNILNFSKEEASRLHCGSVSPLHLLLGIIRHTDNKASQLLAYYLPDGVSQLKSQLEMTARQHQVLISPTPADMNFDTQANRIMRLCKLEASLMKSETIEPIHVLLAILKANDNEASDILQRLDITYEKVQSSPNSSQEEENGPFSQGDGWSDSGDDEDMEPVSAGLEGNVISARQQKKHESKTPALDNFGTDLTYMALNDLLDPVVGREKEIERVAQILNRRKKNNPILIGEPGVGKSAIVEGLAQRIVAHRVSRTLWDKRIVVLDLASVVAGTKYRGQFEERLRCIIKELQQNPDVIVFIDEIHTIVGAGNAAGSMDAANMLKPALSRGEFQCIGSTTLDEFRKTIEKDGALERRFQKVQVAPTTAEETLQILQNLRERYERHHNVRYTDDALLACVKLTGRYITDRSFPDKAIDALDEAGSRMRIQNYPVPEEVIRLEQLMGELEEKKLEAAERQDFEVAADLRDQCKRVMEQIDQAQKDWDKSIIESEKSLVDEQIVAEVISTMTGIPVQRIGQEENERLRNLKETLQQKVIGQDEAVATVSRAIQRSRVGLKDPQRPIGTFLFVGPTGVGKTYLAKCLAEELFGKADAIIRIDMSEYMEKHTVSRMVGAPPGYVGYDEGGQLTEQVRRKPYSIVLLDEIEKAHSDVFNLLLQVMDEGRLTDGNGNTIDFRNTVIIMTSNCGSKQIRDFGRGVGFQSETDVMTGKKQNRDIVKKALDKQFAPEFMNRVDNIVYFDHLSQEDLQQIVDIELRPLLDRIKEMGHSLEVSTEARELLGKKGYDVQFGARPLKRAIQDLIEDPLCEILMEPLSNSPKGEGNLQLKAEVDANNKERITITKQ
ncbi:MAG: ATP-dependent Clp protease ATP-binding subunit [Bacteroidaceae bacterium]|nr:ATP-dependent Clp protease ATP-binding subunit [Bacteroidaceae bacterium]MBQ6224963.1 ATP-dependent Clp protease ATP-binding subunit [Bacteroidaceae bacterium]